MRDTSALVAAFYVDHEHHQTGIDLFLRFGKRDVCCGSHSLTEIYATLTGMTRSSMRQWRAGAAVTRRHP